MQKYIDRLTEEWKQHGRLIVAVDFDDTISPWRTNSQGECDEVIKVLIEASYVGIYMVVFTACKEDRYQEIKDYCSMKGLKVDGINQNPISLPYGNQNKIYANIFIDDRAGLDQSIEILKEAMYRVRAFKSGQLLDNPGSTEF